MKNEKLGLILLAFIKRRVLTIIFLSLYIVVWLIFIRANYINRNEIERCDFTPMLKTPLTGIYIIILAILIGIRADKNDFVGLRDFIIVLLVVILMPTVSYFLW